MITRRDLAQRLAKQQIAAWTVIEREQSVAIADEARGLHRTERRTRIAVIVHHDVPRGRGSARLELVAFDGSPDDVVAQAISLAAAAVGPTWASTPPAAPAVVALADPDVMKRELGAVAEATLRGAKRPAGVAVSASAEVLRERVTVEAHGGFHAAWDATALRVEALASAGEHSVEVVREARRAQDLGFDDALAEAAADLARLAGAGAPTLGPCAVVLRAEALLHGGGHGLWSVFAHQADAVVERQGLTRYRLHGEVAPGAAAGDEPLAITSDGALDFATRSTPVGDDGVAVRRFALVERGAAVGLALSPREAALRRADPNGGVRNLIVAPGTWGGEADGALEVVRLRSLALDAATGDATLEVALAVQSGRAVAGGSLRLDVVAALALARRSALVVQRGPYVGPASVRIGRAELIA